MPKQIYRISATKLKEDDKIIFERTKETFRAKDSSLWLIVWAGDLVDVPKDAVQLFSEARTRLQEEINQYPYLEKIEINYHYNSPNLRVLDFSEALREQQQTERRKAYDKIIKLADHIR